MPAKRRRSRRRRVDRGVPLVRLVSPTETALGRLPLALMYAQLLPGLASTQLALRSGARSSVAPYSTNSPRGLFSSFEWSAPTLGAGPSLTPTLADSASPQSGYNSSPAPPPTPSPSPGSNLGLWGGLLSNVLQQS